MRHSILALILSAIASLAIAGGNSNNNGPKTTGGDTTAIAGALAAQKQAQVQLQGQVGIVKSQNDNALNAAGGAATVVVKGDTVQAPDLSKTVPSMAFTTGNTTAHCIVAVGGSVAVAGFGGAVTGGVVDDFCKRTWLIQYAEGHGKMDVRQKLLCDEPMYAEADPSCWPMPSKGKTYGGGVGAQSFEALGGIGG